MKILSEESNSMTISWLPHGFSFRIHDRPAFLELLTEYEGRFMPGKSAASVAAKADAKKGVSAESQPARTIKWTSLTRKMCRWNILRLSAGPDAGAYFHPKMQRDCPELVIDMVIGSEGATAGDVLKARKERPVPVVAAAPVAVAPVTQLAQAKAQAHMAAQQQLAQAQPSPSLLRTLNPWAPLSPALHLVALNSLQELMERSKLAAIRAAPQFGFDAKVIEAELLSHQPQAGGAAAVDAAVPASTAAAHTTTIPATATALPVAPQLPQRQTITQSILAGAGTAALTSNSATSTPAPIDPALALSIQQAHMETERLRLLSSQIRLSQQRQQHVAAVAAALASPKADATAPKTDMSGKAQLNSIFNAQA